jgi:hypothetical protein
MTRRPDTSPANKLPLMTAWLRFLSMNAKLTARPCTLTSGRSIRSLESNTLSSRGLSSMPAAAATLAPNTADAAGANKETDCVSISGIGLPTGSFVAKYLHSARGEHAGWRSIEVRTSSVGALANNDLHGPS